MKEGERMTIEEDFAFLDAWLSERGGERAQAALSRIEAHCKIAWAKVTVNVNEELLEEGDDLRREAEALATAGERLLEKRDVLKMALEWIRDEDGISIAPGIKSTAFNRLQYIKDVARQTLAKLAE